MKLFDLNNPVMRGLEKVADLIVLNFFFLLCCIPIVTIGPAFAAMYSVTLKLVRNEESSIVKAFFHSFRANFKQGIAIHMLYIAMAILIFIDVRFGLYAVASIGASGYVLLGIAGFLGTMAIATLIYIYPILAQFENTVFSLLKSAWLLAFRHLPTTLLLATFNAVPFVLISFLNEEVIAFLYLMLILGFSSMALGCSHYLRKVFDQYVPQQEESCEARK